jgi:uncharacterized RDD family membrane protein YckC
VGDASSTEPIDTTTEVETPEHVRFRFRVAGPARRAVAYGLDLLVRGAIVAVLASFAMLAGASLGELVAGATTGLLLVFVFLTEWGYYLVFDIAWSGRSPGRRAMGLRVVDVSGHPLRLGQSLLRNLLRAADLLPMGYALGVLVMARDPRFRRIGDRVAGTMVVLEDTSRIRAPVAIDPPPSRAELSALPSRLPVSNEELDAIELYLRRAPSLTTSRAEELAEMLAPRIAERLGARYREPRRFLATVYTRARDGEDVGPRPQGTARGVA